MSRRRCSNTITNPNTHNTWTYKRVPLSPVPLPESLGNNGEHTWDEIQYHARLCQEAGYLILADDDNAAEGVLRLTWAGHEAMDDLAKTFSRRRGY